MSSGGRTVWPPLPSGQHITQNAEWLSVVFIIIIFVIIVIFKAHAIWWPLTARLLLLLRLHQLLAVYITMAACHFSGRGQQEGKHCAKFKARPYKALPYAALQPHQLRRQLQL